MAGFAGRCAREARTLASRRSTTLHRPRCLHSSAPVREADGSSPQKSDQPQGTVFGSQAAFNSFKNNQTRNTAQSSPPAKSQSTPTGNNLFRRTGGSARESAAPYVQLPSKPAGTNLFGRTDDGPPGQTTAPMAIRRTQAASRASAASTRPQGDRSSYQRGTGGVGRGGAARGRGGSRMARPAKSKGKGAGRSSGTRTVAAAEVEFLEYKDFMSGRPISDDFEEEDLKIAYEAFGHRADQDRSGQAFAPDVSAAALLGQGPTTVSSGNGSGELLHRLMSRGAMPLAPTNSSWPTQKAQDLLSGKTVFFHSDEEARNVQEQIKAIRYADLSKYVQTLGPDSKVPKNIGHDLVSFDDIKFETVKEEDRAAVNGAWLAGTYVPPGEGAGKNASEALRNVWNYVARNETYLSESQKALAKKVASLVPSKALPAAVKNKGQQAAASVKAGKDAGQAKQRARA